MQPTYLPWSGYFNLIAQVDRFVFLDDVQYERRSWQSRNRILQQDSELYLTVPVRKAPRDQVVMDMLIDNDQDWRQQHLRSLQQSYGKLPHGPAALAIIEGILSQDHAYLAELNIDLIVAFSQALGLTTDFCRASGLHCDGRRAEHLANICRALACDEYLSPPGSREYLVEDRFAETSGIALSFQQFVPTPYGQHLANEFVSHLSIVDVLAQQGSDFARSYVRSEGL